jgi:cytoskeleton protein RodZ
MQESIGQKLRQARQAQSLTLEEIAQETHMRVYYLRALEDGNYESIPSMAQARGFLRSYAEFLHLDPEPLLDSMDGAPAAPSPVDDSPAGVDKKKALEESPLHEEAQAIFKEVGQRMKTHRELLGLSLDDVVRHTHLRRHYLEALEAGAIDLLPSPVQGRGMLNNYATFLGMDPDAILLRFAEGLQAGLAAKQADRPAVSERREITRTRTRLPRISMPSFLRRVFSNDIWIGGALVVFLLGFALWGAIRIFSIRSSAAPAPTAPSIAEVLLTTETATPTQTPTPVTPTTVPGPFVLPPTQAEDEQTTAEVTLPPDSGQGVQVYITVNQRAWMQVKVDDKVEFEGRVLPGNAYSFAGDEQISVLTGNGAALQIFFNQQDQGLMGTFGQVVNRVYTQEGIQTPTPTITPTSTRTPRPSPTSRPTATPRPGTATVPALP